MLIEGCFKSEVNIYFKGKLYAFSQLPHSCKLRPIVFMIYPIILPPKSF